MILFEYRIAYILNNQKLNPVVTVLFITVRKPNIPLVFIRQSCFLHKKILD